MGSLSVALSACNLGVTSVDDYLDLVSQMTFMGNTYGLTNTNS